MPTVFITGAGSGIGLEFAKQYLKDRWDVVCTVRQKHQADELRSLGAEVFMSDMSQPDSIKLVADQLQHRTIDVLILNAGIMRQRDMLFSSIDVSAWQECFLVNCIAPALWAGSFLTPAKRSSNPKMIALSSGRASIANNKTGSTIMYRASKTALNATWRTLSIDEPELTCFVLHPGRVRTAMGSAQAELSVQESVTAMRQVIDQSGKSESGAFLDYSGKHLPW